MMKRIIYWLIVLSIFAVSGKVAYGQDTDALFEQANQAYTEENYEQAIEKYEAVLAKGFESADLYYNLGNAHYKSKHIAAAVLNYERALELDPGFEDAQYNLQLANLRVKDNVESVPDLLLVQAVKNLVRGFSSGQWGKIAVILFWLAVALGVAFLYVNIPFAKRVSFFGGILLVLASLFAFGVSLKRLDAERSNQFGIILSPNVYVKDAPSGKTDLMILHEGAKVRLVEEIGSWAKIRIDDANVGKVVGFIESAHIEAI